jgi:hypothetical protein
LKTGEGSTEEKQRGEALPDDEVVRRVRAGQTHLLELHGCRLHGSGCVSVRRRAL